MRHTATDAGPRWLRGPLRPFRPGPYRLLVAPSDEQPEPAPAAAACA